MRVLLINKYHFLKGGAERAYFDLARMLEKSGHEVAFFSMQHSENYPTPWEKYFVENVEYQDTPISLWKKLILSQRILFSFEAKKKLELLLNDFQPDIAHVHNIYHQLSPSIFWPLRQRGIPIVMTLHDYKVVSPNYSLFVRGKIWEHTSGFRCIADRCVKDSFSKSIVCVFEQWIHIFLGSYEKVSTFISPSRFLIEKFRELGFRREIVYIPNPLPAPRALPTPLEREPSAALYYGRLSREKGIDTLIQAIASLPHEKVWIVGDGPDRERLETIAENEKVSDRVTFFGSLYDDDLEQIKQKAKCIVLPSLWYENFPYVLIESLQSGAVVIASERGGVTERIHHQENGLLFEAGNVHSLVAALQSLESLPLEEIRKNARESVTDLTEENFMSHLLAVYGNLLKKEV